MYIVGSVTQTNLVYTKIEKKKKLFKEEPNPYVS